MSNQDATIGKAVREYEHIRREIACIRARLHDRGKALTQLGQQLVDNPIGIDPGPSELRFDVGRDNVAVVADDMLDVLAVRGDIAMLRESVRERGRIEDCLRQLGLQQLIDSGGTHA